ncbi:acyltransferase [Rhodococcoides kroppenstedtii]|uniref:acyltransferase n=1 Tax=Rhodococcoides kroppenstedtii TaxID=293050 RepID=UPI0028E1B11E|nr:acyltransferase [Rhodococcus kroppenstedtii]
MSALSIFTPASARSGPSSAASAPVVHPAALCESDTVGPRTRVWAFAHILPGAVVGADCNICDHAYVEGGAVLGDRVTVKNRVLIFDGVTVEDDVFLGPAVVFTNDLRPRAHVRKTAEELSTTVVGRGATLGAGVVVVCGTRIGHDAFVAAGAVVTRDVPPHAVVVGNPGRRIGWACRCGRRLPDSGTCDCGRRWQLTESGPTAFAADTRRPA